MQPKKILLIAEIEGLLCYTQRPNLLKKTFTSQVPIKPDIQTPAHSIKLRPYLDHLTDLIFNQFSHSLELAIWSSLPRNDCIALTQAVLGKNTEKSAYKASIHNGN